MQEMQEMGVWSLAQEDLLEKEMATHSSALAWRIPWMEEPGRLQSMGSQRVGQDWATSLSLSVMKTKISFECWWWVDFSDTLFCDINHFTCVQLLSHVLTLWDPIDSSLPGSSVHGILQATILEWVAISSCRGSSQPRDRTCISYIGRWVF